MGPKGKKAVALAPDWPGLARGAKTADEALERLRAYVPRYAPVADLARMAAQFDTNPNIEVVERYQGAGSTDFWGISFAFSSIDKQAMSSDELERQLTLLRACWSFFDDIRNRVSAELQRGPKGGGRSRDEIVHHVLINEQLWAKKLGLVTSPESSVGAHREAYCAAIRTYNLESKSARTWPLRYLIRHTAYHALDHTWEMEDKDLRDV